MNLPHSRAPHTVGAPGTSADAPNAALLIDFDNVTMGMRSDLSKELKNLLNSDIIKGKVTVQRAYADWRRYPQYIVPLSENSVDLIFAPAYGSSKKNATDIRMAIDGMELVFIRPEIGTFILLTGDSDFSSLVLKLKEYGKYVIGVGIQESSSDILVQNCDEYYSYTSLTGLRKTTDSMNKAVDPWVLVEEAVGKMAARSDVMRSDRLKQVMMEIDPTFDEGNFGFSKFSRFLSEAASRDLVNLRKLENGQYEVRPKGKEKEAGGKERTGPPKKSDAKARGREEDREDAVTGVKGKGERKPRGPEDAGSGTAVQDERKPDSPEGLAGIDPLQSAYGLLKEALDGLVETNGGGPVRDSDLKRRMLELDPSFDEGDLGFGKFSRFLRQAHDHEVVDLEKREEGTYQVTVRGRRGPEKEGVPAEGMVPTQELGRESGPSARVREGPSASEQEDLPGGESGTKAESRDSRAKGLGPRRGERRGRRGKDGPPPILEGQVVAFSGKGAAPAGGGKATGTRAPSEEAGPEGEGVEIGKLGLPSDPVAIVAYLTNSYKGVGKKTAENLVEAFGADLFVVLHEDPSRIGSIVAGRRLEQLLEGWRQDFQRRAQRVAKEAQGRDGTGPAGGGKAGSQGRAGSRGKAASQGKAAPQGKTGSQDAAGPKDKDGPKDKTEPQGKKEPQTEEPPEEPRGGAEKDAEADDPAAGEAVTEAGGADGSPETAADEEVGEGSRKGQSALPTSRRRTRRGGRSRRG